MSITSNEPVYYKSQISEGRSGPWIVEKFAVHDRPLPDGQKDERPEWAQSAPGGYTRLKQGNTVFMTDLYEEWWTQKEAIQEACCRGGRVLITGLGLGLIVESILRTPGSIVERLTVLEASEDVIKLVGPHLRARFGGRLEIINADAFEWVPPEGAHYHVVWHDIWPNPDDPRNLPEIDLLERRYAPFCDWQGTWERGRGLRAGHRLAAVEGA